MYSKTVLIGRLGRDVEIRFAKTGTKVAIFSLVTTKYYKDREGKLQSQAQWHNIVAYGKLADRAEKVLVKGSLALVEGEINYKQWTDNAGNKRYQTEIKPLYLLALSKNDAEKLSNGLSESGIGDIEVPADDFDSDVPF